MNKEIQDKTPQDLQFLKSSAEFLDNKYRFPGTNFRFGADAVLGLIPYAGDVLTFLVGGLLIIMMYKKGASGKLAFKMILNILIDGVTGTIPFIGDIFDFRYRANLKNINLMIEHYEEGRHRGSAWSMIIILLFSIVILIVLSIYTVWKIMYWILI